MLLAWLRFGRWTLNGCMHGEVEAGCNHNGRGGTKFFALALALGLGCTCSPQVGVEMGKGHGHCHSLLLPSTRANKKRPPTSTISTTTTTTTTRRGGGGAPARPASPAQPAQPDTASWPHHGRPGSAGCRSRVLSQSQFKAPLHIHACIYMCVVFIYPLTTSIWVYLKITKNGRWCSCSGHHGHGNQRQGGWWWWDEMSSSSSSNKRAGRQWQRQSRAEQRARVGVGVAGPEIRGLLSLAGADGRPWQRSLAHAEHNHCSAPASGVMSRA